ncbi:MAG: hypothetical protein L3J63_12885 [Geopsychrobacter sp.]|nr:hypothetical protein [Geopsychrobacter sp.]
MARPLHKVMTLALLILAILCFGLMFVDDSGPERSRSITEMFNLGHVFCFALWTFLFVRWRRKLGFWSQLIQVAALALVLGGLTELIQAQLPVSYGREASWDDLLRDLLGSLLVVLFYAPGRRQIQRFVLRGLQLLVLSLAIWSLLPLGRVVADEMVARNQFPQLAGFETSSEVNRWEGNSQFRISQDFFYSGHASLQVALNTDQYSGLSLRYFPVNWSAYHVLRLRVYNPDLEILSLNLRIHDQLHRLSGNAYSDRYNSHFDLKQGWTLLEIPLTQVYNAPQTRRMEMSRIAALGLFVIKLKHPRTLFIDDVELAL